MVYWWYVVFKWYAIQPIHGAVVRLTWYAAVAGVTCTSVVLNLSVPQCTWVYPSVPWYTPVYLNIPDSTPVCQRRLVSPNQHQS